MERPSRQNARNGLAVAGLLSRLLVSAVFLIAAYGKIDDPLHFAEQVAAYRVAPLPLTNAIAYALPWVEVAAAGLLLLGIWRAEARFILLTLLVGFTFLKVYAELSGLQIDCGCFSGPFAFLSKVFEGWRGIGLNVALIAALVIDLLIRQPGALPGADVPPAIPPGDDDAPPATATANVR